MKRGYSTEDVLNLRGTIPQRSMLAAHADKLWELLQKEEIVHCLGAGLAYAPADLIWCETAVPDLDEAQAFADAIHKEHPRRMLGLF